MKLGVHVATFEEGVNADILVDREVLLSWTELLDKFSFCFPEVPKVDVSWDVYQHAIQTDDKGQRYHYWGTDTKYSNSSREGLRRRRDFVRVSLKGEHLCQLVAFVKATYSSPTAGKPSKKAEKIGVLVRWLTPHPTAVMQNGVPMCPGPLQNTHRLWTWHMAKDTRTAISGYRFGRLPPHQKPWLEPQAKRDGLLRGSYDVVEFETLGKYANVTADFDTADGFIESESWA